MRSAVLYQHGNDRGSLAQHGRPSYFGPISHCDGGPVRDVKAAWVMSGVGFALYRAPVCGCSFIS